MKSKGTISHTYSYTIFLSEMKTQEQSQSSNGKQRDAILTVEMKDGFTEKNYYAKGDGLIKKEYTSADGYFVTSALASIGESPKE